MSKFEEGKKVKLDYDTGIVVDTYEDGTMALIEWDSDGEVDKWDIETFLLGEGVILK